MSSMHRVLDGEVLVHHLTREERMLDPELLARHGRTGRTLVKDGPLRLTIMGLAAGGVLPPHSTDAPVTIHLLEGAATFAALGREYPLTAGDVLALEPGVEHSARSETGGLFLLTVFRFDRRPPSAGDGPMEDVDESSDESFPASDPPGWSPLHAGQPIMRTPKSGQPPESRE